MPYGRKSLCRGPDLNRHGRYRPTDFKSVVSTIPPPRQGWKIKGLGEVASATFVPCGENCGDFAAKLLQHIVRLLFVIGRQVYVAECHSNALMSHQFLHSWQVSPRHHQTARKGMTQVVEREILNTCPLDCTFKRRPKIPVGSTLWS